MSSGFIEVLSAEQRPGKSDWFQGTADAVRQNVEYLKETSAEFFLILSGDQLYHLDFEKFAACTTQQDVDVWVATLAVNASDASRMGIMKVDNSKHIVDFCEKPSADKLLHMKTSQATLCSLGAEADEEKEFLGSMGIYLFRRAALLRLLAQDLREDFGKHLIPTQVKQGRIAAFVHNGYWEDIGTVDSFYHANLALNHQNPSFVCHSEYQPMCSTPSHLPAPRFFNTNIHASTICEGAVIDQAYISNSILGQRTIIKKGSSICDSYLMGNDYYEPIESLAPIIEEDCTIHRAIIDQNVRIGKRVCLINKNNLQHYDGPSIYIRDGIIVVPKGAHIPDDFVL